MIEDIWQTAPAGATHYQPARGEGFNPVFWRVENGVPGEAWAVMGNSTLQHIPKPSYIDDVFERLIPRPAPQWNGEGLPPIGLVCEVDNPHEPGEWHECTILVHDGEIAVFGCCNGYPYVYDGQSADSFRPIRTPEQIAADERLHKISNACTAIARTLDQFASDIPGGAAARAVIEAMIDAGYKRHDTVQIPDELAERAGQ